MRDSGELKKIFPLITEFTELVRTVIQNLQASQSVVNAAQPDGAAVVGEGCSSGFLA